MSAGKHKDWSTAKIYQYYKQASDRVVWQSLQSPLHLMTTSGKTLSLAALAAQASMIEARVLDAMQRATTEQLAHNTSLAFELASTQNSVISSLLSMDQPDQLIKVVQQLAACNKIVGELTLRLNHGVAAAARAQLAMRKMFEEKEKAAPEYMSTYAAAEPSANALTQESASSSFTFNPMRRQSPLLQAGSSSVAPTFRTSATKRDTPIPLDVANALIYPGSKTTHESESVSGVASTNATSKVYENAITGAMVGECTYISHSCQIDGRAGLTTRDSNLSDRTQIYRIEPKPIGSNSNL